MAFIGNPQDQAVKEDPESKRKRLKKKKEQEFRDAAGTSMILDAYEVDKEEGRLVKNRTDINPKTRKKRRGKTQAARDGGKVYASQNKKYGGGVYPRKTVGSDN